MPTAATLIFIAGVLVLVVAIFAVVRGLFPDGGPDV